MTLRITVLGYELLVLTWERPDAELLFDGAPTPEPHDLDRVPV
jgi:hypothetical protein